LVNGRQKKKALQVDIATLSGGKTDGEKSSSEAAVKRGGNQVGGGRGGREKALENSDSGKKQKT